MSKSLLRVLLTLSIATLLLAVFASPALAAIARTGNTVTIGRGEAVKGDMYVAANKIVVDGRIDGDLIAVAQQITFTGQLTGDLQCAAQVISIDGTVGDDARIAAQTIQLGPRAHVFSDLLAASQSLDLQQGGVVDQDLWSAGSDGRIAGTVGRDFLGAYNGVEIAGNIGRNVDLQIGAGQSGVQGTPQTPGQISVTPGLIVDSTARIGGKLVYTSSKKAEIQSGAVIAKGVQQKLPKQRPRERPENRAVAFVLNQIRRLVSTVIVGLLLIWLFPTWTGGLAAGIERKPWPALGWGLVAFIAFIGSVIAVLFLMTFLAVLLGIATLARLVGLVLALGFLSEVLLVVGYIIFVVFIAEIVVSLVLGRLVFSRTSAVVQPVVALLVGILIYWVVTMIPILGGLVAFLAALFALGALWMWATGLMRPAPPEQPPSEQPAPPAPVTQ